MSFYSNTFLFLTLHSLDEFCRLCLSLSNQMKNKMNEIEKKMFDTDSVCECSCCEIRTGII